MIELLRQRRPGVGVVLMSGYAEGLDQAAGDAVVMLDKPFSSDELALALERARKEVT